MITPMRRTVALTTLLALTATACAGASPAAPTATVTVTAMASAEPAPTVTVTQVVNGPVAEPTPTAEPTATDSGNTTLAFGDTGLFTNGVKITVTLGKRVSVSDTAAGKSPDGTMQVVTVKLTNGGAKAFDASALSVAATHGADGTAADTVYDSAQDVNGLNFTTLLRPGKSLSATGAYGIPKGQVLTLFEGKSKS